MFRHLLMFPRSADPAYVDELVTAGAAIFRACPGCRSVTANVDALMGPSAEAGVAGRIMEVDFDTLDDALGALETEGLQEIGEAVEALGTTIFLYEHRDV